LILFALNKNMTKKEKGFHLLWLDWPYDAFRLNRESLNLYRSLANGDEVKSVTSEKAFLKELPKATTVVTWQFKKEWFNKAPKLRLLATPAAGRELLPTDAEMPKGVTKLHGAFHGQIMSETVIACVFAHARGLFAAKKFQDENVLWPRSEMSRFCNRVAGTNAVILGYGKIGKSTGEKLTALGVHVEGVTRKNIAELPNYLKTADWLIVALPSDTGTDNIINAKMISKLPRNAVIINVGRGNSIDEEALANALLKGRIAAAFLDVFKDEPLKENSPLAENIPCLYRMPHVSAFAPEYIPLFFEEMAVKGFFK
jgi:phosphoglycerate dehydrogenase-like enzyme